MSTVNSTTATGRLSRRSFLAMAACACALPLAGRIATASGATEAKSGDATREITDMAGRTVTIPAEVNSVYCAVPTGEAMVSTLAPTKLVGWVNSPTDATLEYLPEQLASLPVIGGWMGQQVTANLEDIIKLNPDVIIYMGTAKSLATDSVPDDIQTNTGIPVVCVPSSLEKTAEVYRTLGDWVGEAERGEELATWYEDKLKELTDKVATVPEDELPRVYYAENSDGLATDPTGSQHTEVIDYCRAINVADVEMLSGQGRTEVSIEQVIGWNPEIILCHSGFLLSDTIYDDPMWADIDAVKNGRVYTTPAVPFNWFDRPPNVMRVLGIDWFANVCYPDLDLTLEQDVRDFFKLFYLVDLTDEQLDSLLHQDEISYKENQK